MAAKKPPHRTREPEPTAEQEAVMRKTIQYTLRKLGHLLVPGTPTASGNGKWVVPLIYRSCVGPDGEVGAIAYDEQRDEFTLLTDRAAMDERIRPLAAVADEVWTQWRALLEETGTYLEPRQLARRARRALRPDPPEGSRDLFLRLVRSGWINARGQPTTRISGTVDPEPGCVAWTGEDLDTKTLRRKKRR